MSDELGIGAGLKLMAIIGAVGGALAGAAVVGLLWLLW